MSRKFTYSDVLSHISELTGGKPNRSPHNLEITTRLARAMRLNLNPAPSIHVAGTKGKGTTSFLCAELLRHSGMRVGLFTSPHLVDVRERFLVDGNMIPKDRFAEYWGDAKCRMKDVLDNASSQLDRESASRSNYFRFLFLTSLIAFEAEKVDAVVYEVGVGGRIDSTNVITPKVCGITSLGMDHMDVLGPTISHIAAEKAGIMKAGIPCFSQRQVDFPETEAILVEHARRTDTPFAFVDEDIVTTRMWPQLAMGGDHMKRNGMLAIALTRVFRGLSPADPLERHETHVLKTAQFPGRSQVVPIPSLNCTLYIDGAHTPESMERGVAWFAATAQIATAEADPNMPQRESANVVLMFSTRDPEKLLKPLELVGRGIDKIIFAPTAETRGGPDSAVEAVANLAISWEGSRTAFVPMEAKSVPYTSLEDLVKDARRQAGGSGGDDVKSVVNDKPLNILVTGSLYMVGNALEMIMRYMREQGLAKPPSQSSE